MRSRGGRPRGTRGLGSRGPSAGAGRPGAARGGREQGPAPSRGREARQRRGPRGLLSLSPCRGRTPTAAPTPAGLGLPPAPLPSGSGRRPWPFGGGGERGPFPPPVRALPPWVLAPAPSPTCPGQGAEARGQARGPGRAAGRHLPAGELGPALPCRTALKASGGGGVSAATGRVRARRPANGSQKPQP